MTGSDDSLREYDVDDEEENDTCCDEDLSCDSDANVLRMCAPCEAHGTRNYSCHAETEEHPRHKEFVALSLVELEDRHVHNCSPKEES